MFHVERAVTLALLLLLVAPVRAAPPERVAFRGPGVELAGLLYRPEGAGPFPAIVLMHGCSGMWTARDQPNPSYADWGRRLAERGFVALLLDSFGPRGQKEICTQKERRVSEARDRPRDAYAALGWLANRADVRASEVHLMGWSNGGSAVLHALRADAPGRLATGPQFRSGVAFYPGCSNRLLHGYYPIAPLLIQAGGADDWTPASRCEDLARHAVEKGATVAIDVYRGAHHAFDRLGDGVRKRPDVRNLASRTGWGATVGAHPEAREKSRMRTFEFLQAAP